MEIGRSVSTQEKDDFVYDLYTKSLVNMSYTCFKKLGKGFSISIEGLQSFILVNLKNRLWF